MLDIVSSLTGRIRSSTQDMMFTLAVYAVVGLFGLTAYVALLYALGLVISAEAGPLMAALSIACWSSISGKGASSACANFARGAPPASDRAPHLRQSCR
jgi:hypothetical protein